jgi:hypothetical protein
VRDLRRIAIAAAGGLLTACATVPTGPSVMVLPGSRTSFEQFQLDDSACRGWAGQQIGASPNQAATNSAVTSAAVGTAVGAAAGAAIGAASGHPGEGAAIGAGSGLLVGSAAGASASQYSGASAQERYDTAYLQCMYAKGNKIPVAEGYLGSGMGSPPPPPPTSTRALRVPPPPPGPPPPPPPDAS